MFFKQSTNQSSAAVVDGNLIISLPGAINPVVWRMALGEAKSSALEIREKAGEHVLILKTPKGEVNDIAPFARREDALAALMAISKTMQSAQGKIQPTPSIQPAVIDAGYKAREKTSLSSVDGLKWIGAFAVVLVAVFLFSKLLSLQPVNFTDSQLATSSVSANPSNQTGVPVSADAMLSGL